ncbi:MAG: hypothetical protein NTZ18_03635 [Candidatus Komeilibacteria bacterium]|nr:hypothetical protein [Candidatus Komeilibacteria bacterium]
MSNREVQTIKLSDNTDVDIVTYLTWGEKEQIQSIFVGGAKVNKIDAQNQIGDVTFEENMLFDAKIKALSLAIKSIRLSDGQEVSFTREWMENLRSEDGDLIFNAVNQMNKKKL